MAIESYFVTDQDRVRQNGKIFPWAAVRILCKSVSDFDKDNYAGLWIYSEELTHFTDGSFKAVCENNTLVIYKNGDKVHQLKRESLRIPELWLEKVAKNGYLECIGTYGMTFAPIPFPKKEFKKLLEGKDPNYIDESVYIQVSPTLSGEKLIHMNFSIIGKKPESHLVCTMEGKPIIFSIDTPFSAKRQGKKQKMNIVSSFGGVIDPYRNYDRDYEI